MSTKSYTETRFSANDAVLVLIDHQSGIMQLVHDYSPAEFRNNVIGLAKLGKVYKLPTVLTTSYDQGPNGPIIPELLSMFPGAPLIRRTTGTISAWDYPEFVAAIEKTGRKNLIMAGVTIDVCLFNARVHLRGAGLVYNSPLVEWHQGHETTTSVSTEDELTAEFVAFRKLLLSVMPKNLSLPNLRSVEGTAMLVRAPKQLRQMRLLAAIGGSAGVWDRAAYGLAIRWLLRQYALDDSHQFPAPSFGGTRQKWRRLSRPKT